MAFHTAEDQSRPADEDDARPRPPGDLACTPVGCAPSCTRRLRYCVRRVAEPSRSADERVNRLAVVLLRPTVDWNCRRAKTRFRRREGPIRRAEVGTEWFSDCLPGWTSARNYSF